MLNSADEYRVRCCFCRRFFQVPDSELPSGICRQDIQAWLDILLWYCAGCTHILECVEDRGQFPGRLEA